MIKAEDGRVIFEGKRDKVLAEAVTILLVLKESVSEEEYKMVIGLADKSEKQIEDECEKMKEELKKLLGL
jgi:hypothetical protein|nr:MAG TPA: hypothetical protein [Bacteriophage sp.]